MGLQHYNKKRQFDKTPEPKGKTKSSGKQLRFVVQRHHASRLHYDFRLEMEGVLKSWAVPKGPSLNPTDKRLAVEVEDHPFSYRTFKGIIPEGNYGAGVVEIFDEGTYTPLENPDKKPNEKVLLEALKKGDLKIVLNGGKLNGAFALVRLNDESGKNWLLIKKKDESAITKNYDIEKIAPLKSISVKVKSDFEKTKLIKKSSGSKTIASKKTISKKVPLAKDEKKQVKSSIIKKKDFAEAINNFARPMLAQLVNEVIDDKEWIYEYKWDGYRTIAAINDGEVQLISRNNLSLNLKFIEIAEELKIIDDTVIIDGEVVAVDETGNHKFQLLQRFSQLPKGKLQYYIFDILYLNGESLVHLELMQRKELMELFFKQYNFKNVLISEYINEKGSDLFEKAKKRDWEGIVAKEMNSTYTPGQRSYSWKKIKTSLQQEFIICGYTAPTGGRSKFGSLLLGVYENKNLKSIGHCGSGFTEDILIDIFNKMQPLKQNDCPFDKKPELNNITTWLKPKLVCEIKFAQFTNEGQLRNAVFKGLRNDKKAKGINIESAANNTELKPINKQSSAAANKKTKVVSKKTKEIIPAKTKEPNNPIIKKTTVEIKIKGFTIKVSNPDKIYWPKEKYSKGDLLNYYKNVASTMVPYLKDRPHSLNRHPNGVRQPSFYQKDVDTEQMPEFIKTLKVHSESGDKYIDYMMCQNEASLLYMANLGCIEINPWNSRQNKIGNPDWVVIDLDPGDNTFKQVVKTALITKQVFDAIGVNCYCKTSGASGIHIYAPAQAKYDYDHIKNFAELIANFIHQQLPDITSIERSPAKRKKLIYIDFLQNRRGQTLAAPYCVRPQPGATVSTPLNWDEVNSDLSPSQFTMFNILDRIEKIGDIWNPVLGNGFTMEKALKEIDKL